MRKSKKFPSLIGLTESFIHSNITGGILLLIFAIIAVLAANVPALGGLHRFWDIEAGFEFGSTSFKMPVRLWVNDVLMAIFFFSVGLEIKREALVGEISSPKRAMLPVFAALGGMIFPALIYTIFNLGTPSQNGWGIPMATDIAFAIGVLSLLGNKCPVGLKIFLTALAVVDDIGAIIVLAIFYPTHDIHFIYLFYALLVILLLVAFNRMHIKSTLAYLIPGVFLFIFIFNSGIHATIAGVILAMTIPAKSSVNELRFYVGTKDLLEKFKHAGNNEIDVLANNKQLDYIHRISKNAGAINPLLNKMEAALHPWVHFIIMPVFALANAGVVIDTATLAFPLPPVMVGIFFGLLVGKPLGIFTFSYLAVKLKLAQLPSGSKWIQVLALGVVGGIGFTMSIFIDNLAFTDQTMVNEGKLAILVTSLLAGLLGVLAINMTNHKTNKK